MYLCVLALYVVAGVSSAYGNGGGGGGISSNTSSSLPNTARLLEAAQDLQALELCCGHSISLRGHGRSSSGSSSGNRGPVVVLVLMMLMTLVVFMLAAVRVAAVGQ